MPKIIKFPKKKRRCPVSVAEYIDALDAVEFLVEEIRPNRLKAARSIINEMKLCAMFNHKFREQTKEELQQLIDDLYAEAQGE